MFKLARQFIFSTEIMLTIRNRTAVVFREPVKAVTSVNDKGRFDILPDHTNFISIITDYIIIHKKDGTKQEMKITRGVMKVQQNNVMVYLGIVPGEQAASQTPNAPQPKA